MSKELTNAIRDYETAATEYANAVNLAQRIEDERHVAKAAAVLRLLETTNPLTQKPYTVTAAESYVECDAGYSKYLTKRRDANLFKMREEVRRDCARFRVASLANQSHTPHTGALAA